MSWNKPGGDKKDPWSGRDQDKQPPDLDEVIRSLQTKLGGIFGSGGKGGSDGGGPEFSVKGIGFILVGLLILWGFTGIYTVDEGLHGVETQFGKYIGTTPSGLHWHIPFPIEAVEKVDVQRQRFIEVGYRSGGRQQALGSVPREALMLTEDENIVDVRVAVQYQVKDAANFLFNVKDPGLTLKQVTESAVRAVIGTNKMDYVLKEGRSDIVAVAKRQIQTVMDSYGAGISVASVNMQDAQPPEEVQGAFEDAIKAREDKQRLINEAEAYSNDVIPKARGGASRLMQEAEAYRLSVIAEATGETNRFNKLLAEYRKAPEVTRKRLYIEAVESVLSNTNKVMINVKGSNNLLYLPLDKIVGREHSPQTTAGTKGSRSTPAQQSATRPQSLRSSNRGRGAGGR